MAAVLYFINFYVINMIINYRGTLFINVYCKGLGFFHLGDSLNSLFNPLFDGWTFANDIVR